jgi:hypothetical protein
MLWLAGIQNHTIDLEVYFKLTTGFGCQHDSTHDAKPQTPPPRLVYQENLRGQNVFELGMGIML